MNKNKILVVLIVLLLLANAALLYLYLGKDKHPKREGRRMFFREQLKKEAGFTDDQMTRFEKMREDQRRQMEPLMDSMTRLRGEIFDLATGQYSDSAFFPGVNRLAAIQGKIDLQMLKNFREARTICTPEQVTKFDSAMKRMMMFAGRKKGPPQPGNKPGR